MALSSQGKERILSKMKLRKVERNPIVHLASLEVCAENSLATGET